MRFVLLFPLLSTAGCLKDETITGFTSPETVWQLVELAGSPVSTDATLRFPGRGAVEGHAPCNRFSARQTAPYPWISIEEMILSKAACPDLALEATYIAARQEAQIVEVAGDILILSNESGVLASFRAQ